MIKYIVGVILIFASFYRSVAQLPTCIGSGGYVYILEAQDGLGVDSTRHIWNWNPDVPLSASNPSLNTINTINFKGAGLAVSRNLNAAYPEVTFYSTVSIPDSGAYYHYYDGNSWVNTGHRVIGDAVNLAAGGRYIYNLFASEGAVYRYDGTGTDSLIARIGEFSIESLYAGGGPYDMTADCEGNFYLLRVMSPAWLRKYSPEGILLQQWTVTGVPTDFPVGSGFGGLAIVDNMIYYNHDINRPLLSGVMGPSSIHFFPVLDAKRFLPFRPDDFATCPTGGNGIAPRPRNDTLFTCEPGSEFQITVTGMPPYTYTILSGDAKVTSEGANFTIRPTNATQIVLHSQAGECKTFIPQNDTFMLVPAPILDAGLDETLYCNDTTDTLHATFGPLTPWINYHIEWQPAAAIVFGHNTLNPVTSLQNNTYYIITATTGLGAGNCNWIDTVHRDIYVDTVGDIRFTISDSVLCAGKSILFEGSYTTRAGLMSVIWDFGDGNVLQDEKNVIHAYDSGGIYIVRFKADYRGCTDTTFTDTVVVTEYPKLDLGQDTSICLNSKPILLRDAINENDSSAAWQWSNGATQSSIAITHHGYYSTTVTINGCSTSDTIWVKKDCYIDIPNTFTPNGDGTNDYFFPRQLSSRNLKGFNMVIYNRWGQVIFETKNPSGRGWDGKFNGIDQPQGVYIYSITVKLENEKEEWYKGNITLLK